jgi:hypothetical protein
MRGELATSAMRPRRASVVDVAWFVAAIANAEFEAVVCFCGLGLSITICFMRFVPDYGAIVGALGP